MSQNKNDKPHAGHQEGMEYERDAADTRPEKGRLFVKKADGTVQLGQTDKTFGKGHGHSERAKR